METREAFRLLEHSTYDGLQYGNIEAQLMRIRQVCFYIWVVYKNANSFSLCKFYANSHDSLGP